MPIFGGIQEIFVIPMNKGLPVHYRMMEDVCE